MSDNFIKLHTRDGSKASISLLGGQLLQWQPVNGGEQFYLSQQADYSGAHSIRGGVPVCFPQFSSQGKLPKHGLVRQKPWQLLEHRNAGDYALAVLSCSADAGTRQYWPHEFMLELTLLIEGNNLQIELEVHNTGTSEFAFSAALHSYLACAHIGNTNIYGLQQRAFRDAISNKLMPAEADEFLEIDGPIDRVYRPDTALADSPSLVQDLLNLDDEDEDLDGYAVNSRQIMLLIDQQHKLQIVQQGFSETVLWNPAAVGSAALSDMPVDDYKRFVCIEAAIADRQEILPAGDIWLGRQDFTLME